MPPFFSFNARVLSVVDPKRICVRIDNNDLEKISAILSNVENKTIIKSTITLNISDCRFTIRNIEWKELTDLIGVHINVNATYRQYNFWRTRESGLDDNNESIRHTVRYKGITFLAKKISNIL